MTQSRSAGHGHKDPAARERAHSSRLRDPSHGPRHNLSTNQEVDGMPIIAAVKPELLGRDRPPDRQLVDLGPWGGEAEEQLVADVCDVAAPGGGAAAG